MEPLIEALHCKKGGTGKSSFTGGLGTILAKGIQDEESEGLEHILWLLKSRKVGLVDTDSQCNLTRMFSNRDFPPEQTVYSCLANGSQAIFHETDIENLYLLPAHVALDNIDVMLTPAGDRDLRLKNTLKQNNFKLIGKDGLEKENISLDVILIDCPPSTTTITRNAYVAADKVLVITSPERFALDGIEGVYTLKEELNNLYDHDLKIDGIVLNKFFPAKKKGTEEEKELHFMSRMANLELKTHETYSRDYIDVQIPYSDSVGSAQWFYKNIAIFRPKATTTKALTRIAVQLFK